MLNHIPFQQLPPHPELEDFREPIVTLEYTWTDGEQTLTQKAELPNSAASATLLLGEHGFDWGAYENYKAGNGKKPAPAIIRAKIIFGNVIDRFGSSP